MNWRYEHHKVFSIAEALDKQIREKQILQYPHCMKHWNKNMQRGSNKGETYLTAIIQTK